MKKLINIVLFFIFFLPTFSMADTHQKNKVTVSVGMGEYFFSKDRYLDNKTVPFLALGYYFNPHWGIEALLSQFHTTLHEPNEPHRRVSGTLFTVDGLYLFYPCYWIEPYLLAGVGVIGLNPNGDDANNEGNINAGLGVQFPINSLLAIRFDARDLYTFTDGKNDILVNAGLSLSFNL